MWVFGVVDPSLPQILQPPLPDPERSASTHSLSSLQVRETSCFQLPPGVTVRAPPSPPTEAVVASEQPSSQASISPRAKHNTVRKLSTCRDPLSFPEVDLPVKYVPFCFRLLLKIWCFVGDVFFFFGYHEMVF